MSQTPIDASVVKRVASLAKLALTADEELKLAGELRQIVSYVEQLGEVDVTRFEPLGASDGSARLAAPTNNVRVCRWRRRCATRLNTTERVSWFRQCSVSN
ncbi:MAG: Asp-tRNA(Asn)/Glu-tRNA(Gln) amidotransferase subunit GatC [Pirellulaceae bacterium]